MESFPKNITKDLKEKVQNSPYIPIAEGMQRLKEEQGLAAAVEKLLAIEKIKPVYTLKQENADLFAESRVKLNTEAGLVIANHPGYFDTFLILNTIKREDVKFVVNESYFKKYSSILGEENLIAATKDPSLALTFLKSIKTHIENGGVVILYPTGGDDRVDKDKGFLFQDGLSVILRKCLAPNHMVYSFKINPEDIKPLVTETISRSMGAASAILTHDLINTNQLKDEVEIRVDETYSKAGDWQAILSTVDKEGKNKVLTEHFLNQFNK